MLISKLARSVAGAAIAVLVAVSLAACSSGASTGGSAASSGTGDGSEFTQTAEALMTEASAEQTATPPTEGPAIVPDVKIVIIPCAMAAEGCARPARAADEAAKLLGWDSTIIDPAGDPRKTSDAVLTAISQKVDAIVFSVIDASSIEAPLQQAKDAGIKVINYDVAGEWDWSFPSEEQMVQDGYLSGAAAFSLAGDDLKMIRMEETYFSVDALRQDGLDKFLTECKDAGESCDLMGSQTFQLADMATSGPQQAAALARSHPGYNVLWSPFDAGLTFFSQGIQQAGLAGDAFAISFDANSANSQEIRDGGFQKATIGLPLEWVGYAMIDSLNRVLAGEPTVDQGIAAKFLTAENLPAEGAWEGDVDWKAAYENLWGL